MKIASLIVVAVLALNLGGQALATTYSAVDNFSIVANPNGPWSYYDKTPGSGYNLLSTSTTCVGVSGLECWSDGLATPNFVGIGVNTTNGNLAHADIIQSPSVLWLDPQSYTAILRFTAPVAGNYVITGDFVGIATDTNSVPVDILNNGVSIYSGIISQYNQVNGFSFNLDLAAADTIDYQVMTGLNGPTTYSRDGTGLELTINGPEFGVPEPTSLALLVMGMIGIAFNHRHRHPRHSGPVGK